MATPAADYQASLLGLLMGEGTPYEFGLAGIQGLGNPTTKSQDTELHGREGSVGGPDYRDVRPFLVHLEIVQDTDTDAMNALALLQAAWLPVAADIPLYIQLPGMGLRFWNGRPRELEVDLTDLKQGHITCIGTFVALDPQGTSA